MYRKTLNIALLITLLIIVTVTAVAAQEPVYPIRVQVDRDRYAQIDFQEFPVHKVILPRGFEYLELQSRDGERSRVSFDEFPTVFGVEIPVVPAALDLQCGATTYTVDTGNNQGTCVNSGGEVDCADNKGNSAGATCEDGCTGSSGSGSCKIK